MNTLKAYELNDQLLVDPQVLFLENTLGVKIPIALRLVISSKEHLAGWHDTMRSHMIRYKSYTLKDNKVTLVADDDSIWTFSPLTLDLFHSVKDHLVPIGREFSSDEELRSFYANANF